VIPGLIPMMEKRRVAFVGMILCPKTKNFFLYFWGQKYKKKTLFYFNCFSVAKSSKSHPTDSDVGVRTSESGVGRLRGFASKPSPPLSLSALRPLFRHRNQVGNRLAG